MESPLRLTFPERLALTIIVNALLRSRRNTLNRGGSTFGEGRLVLPIARFSAAVAKSTKRPSGESRGKQESLLPPAAEFCDGPGSVTSCAACKYDPKEKHNKAAQALNGMRSEDWRLILFRSRRDLLPPRIRHDIR